MMFDLHPDKPVRYPRLFLIGLMGAGKTTVGRLLGTQLHLNFVDTDHVIQDRTGVSIPTIFEIEGEARFRDRECQVIDELTQTPEIVLATGGGAVLREQNRAALKSRGLVVYLHGQPRDLWLRTRHDRNRPILQGVDPLQKLTELYAVRDPLYRETAHIVIDTGRQQVRSLVDDLLARITAFQQESHTRDGTPSSTSINALENA
jgi:shikimate kinase